MKLFKYFLLVLLIVVSHYSCAPGNARFSKDKAAFDASKVLMHFKSVSELNDSYFEIRENNFFNFYRQLFDSIQNTQYAGKFSMNGDTMVLDFYNKKGSQVIGKKALLNKDKNEIIFFDDYIGSQKKWILF